MNSVLEWFGQLFTSGAIIIVAIYFLAPLFHLIQSYRDRRRLYRRIATGNLNPHGFETRLELGEIYARSRRWKSAARELEEAVEIFPEHAHCRSLYGRALFHLGRYEEATAQMEKALALRPGEGYGATQVLLGRCYESLGDSEKAADWYRAAAQRNSSICEPEYRLALVLRETGSTEEYRSTLRQAVKRFSYYDRTNFWKNLSFASQARLRLLFGY